MGHISFGDICKSRYWLSIERRPWAWWRWILSFGPTYCGTTHGVCLCLPFCVVLGHRRNLDWEPGDDQAYKSLACLHYQCAEGNCVDTALYKRMGKMLDSAAHHVVGQLDEYEEAEWG